MGARILKKGEHADCLYGREDVLITREDLKELAVGKRLYIDVNCEYAVVVKVKGADMRGEEDEHTAEEKAT